MRTYLCAVVGISLLVSSTAAFDEKVGKAVAKSGATVEVTANDEVLAGAEFDPKGFLLQTASMNGKDLYMVLTCVITKSVGDDDEYRFTAYDKEGVALGGETKMGRSTDTKMKFNEKTRVRLKIPLETTTLKFTR